MANPVLKPTTGMLISGIFSSEIIDSSGEQVILDGIDISDAEEGRAVANYEHNGPQGNGQEVVGKIVYVKKIFKESDCDNEDQKHHWDKVKVPYLYGIIRLYDGAGHPGAISLAAQIRDHYANKEPILIRYSVEGSILQQDKGTVSRSILKRVALTLKPANRTCDSDLLADPNAPKGFEVSPKENLKDILSDLTVTKFEHPEYQKLGGSIDVEFRPIDDGSPLHKAVKAMLKAKVLIKAYSAGGGTAMTAPSNLTGGAAVAKEQLDPKKKEFVLNRVRAALRDYAKPIFNKAEFKEFLKNRLQDVDESYFDYFVDVAEKFHDLKLKKSEPEEKGSPTIHLDSEKGVLHTAKGDMPLNTSPLHWKAILEQPEFKKNMDMVVHNMKVVHGLRKRGVVIPGESAVAAITGAFSSNEGVNAMERAVGHTVDLMHKYKWDPGEKPPTEEIEEEFKARLRNKQRPEHAPQLFEDLSGQQPTKTGSMEARKVEALHFVHRVTPFLDDLVAKHRDDGEAILGHLLSAKSDYERWKNRQTVLHNKALRQTAIEQNPKLFTSKLGKEEIEKRLNSKVRALSKQYGSWASDRSKKFVYGGPILHGLDSKTLSYALLLMGYPFNVGDTHYARNILGLSLDHPDLDWHKTQLYDRRNAPVLREISKYHNRHHPVAQWVKDTYYDGKDDPHSEGTAFWAHWAAIPEWDKLMGQESRASSGDRFHRSYWSAVDSVAERYGLHNQLIWKSEGSQLPLEDRIGLALAEISHQYGPAGAVGAYYGRFAPLLFDRVRGADSSGGLLKMDGLSIKLLKALADDDPVLNSRYIDADLHGDIQHNLTQEQKDLIHGIDTETWKQGVEPPEGGRGGINRKFWAKNAKGERLIVKPESGQYEGNTEESRNEVRYANLARDVFGLGHYVPTTAFMYHPKYGRMSVQKVVNDATHPLTHPDHPQIYKDLSDSGEIDKLAIMNNVLGSADRHRQNYLFGPEGRVHLIDNGRSVSFRDMIGMPHYVNQAHRNYLDSERVSPHDAGIHAAASMWLRGLDPVKLKQKMKEQGASSRAIRDSVRRLKVIQARHAVRPHDWKTRAMSPTGQSGLASFLYDVAYGSVGEHPSEDEKNNQAFFYQRLRPKVQESLPLRTPTEKMPPVPDQLTPPQRPGAMKGKL